MMISAFVNSSTDDSFVWRGNQGPGSIGDEQDLSDNESQLSGSALVDSCLWVGETKIEYMFSVYLYLYMVEFVIKYSVFSF